MLHVRQRLQVYRFFSQLFRYPDAGLLQEIAAGRIDEIAAWLQLPGPVDVPQNVADLQEEYTGLFIARQGGIPAPLYGSVYLDDDGRLMGASTVRVADCYRARGLSLDDDGEPADFLSTELEYLYFLVGREVDGLSERQLEKVREMTTAQRDFLTTLLLPWLEPFSERLRPLGDGLYPWAARALLVFVRQESAWLEKLT
ncbi:hypothetical protein C2E25_13010 [Geothermobacter hydrogeniphilus]|uniref:Chaperone TorD involved in molybdoenzyme TorA maturation n=1 Tax=Geothermobacter hydrogeniphilus TaxID=1969733 RepID=A0A2K2H7W1_9BACT|nr:molecular chaperone TorD family protein [Geothermobacter hydrogeniphilus]PNU19323.1 hypothetical protein C2E25_13010 [Geothermobacter hydrogeniphilus]